MKILFVCNEYPPIEQGGIGIFVKSISEELVTRGQEVYVHCMHGDYKQSFWEEIEGVKIYRMSENSISQHIIKSFVNRWRQSQSVRRIVKAHKISLVESYEWAGPIILHPGAPLVVRLHGGHHAHAVDERKRGSRLLRIYEQRTLLLADFVVAVSEHMKMLTRKAYGVNKKIEVIYNFFDSKKFHLSEKLRRDRNLVLFVGKFHERKGVYEMFDRLNELLLAQTEVKFHFVGGYTEENKSYVLNHLNPQVVRRIEFVGKIPHDQLSQCYQKAAYTLVPSRAEAFGLIAIEAMACGSIVVMSEGHVSSELIENGQNGFIIDYNKSNALLNLMDSLNVDSKRYKEISDSAENNAKRFEMDYIIRENLAFYLSIIAQ